LLTQAINELQQTIFLLYGNVSYQRRKSYPIDVAVIAKQKHQNTADALNPYRILILNPLTQDQKKPKPPFKTPIYMFSNHQRRTPSVLSLVSTA
jgi:hypothetical protein